MKTVARVVCVVLAIGFVAMIIACGGDDDPVEFEGADEFDAMVEAKRPRQFVLDQLIDCVQRAIIDHFDEPVTFIKKGDEDVMIVDAGKRWSVQGDFRVASDPSKIYTASVMKNGPGERDYEVSTLFLDRDLIINLMAVSNFARQAVKDRFGEPVEFVGNGDEGVLTLEPDKTWRVEGTFHVASDPRDTFEATVKRVGPGKSNFEVNYLKLGNDVVVDPFADQYRTFTDDTGEFTIRAKFLRFEFKGSKVVLEKPDGTFKTLSMNRLSKDDQQYVTEELKRRREAGEK